VRIAEWPLDRRDVVPCAVLDPDAPGGPGRPEAIAAWRPALALSGSVIPASDATDRPCRDLVALPRR
jgi:hypothetical protein